MSLWQMVMALDGVEDRADYHPERDQLNHSVQVALNAARETGDPRLLAAAALHDVGKAACFAARGNGHGHESASAEMIEGHVASDVVWLVANHLRVAAYLSGDMGPRKAAQLAAHPLFPLLCQLRRFDVTGRRPHFALTPERRERFTALCEGVGIATGPWP